MNMEKARYNMIEQQIKPWNVFDPRVLDAISATPRESFVPEAYQHLAFTDTQLPLPQGQVMMPPREEARLLQALAIDPTETVLEVGTGSGYLTALLAKMASRVVSVDIFPEFIDNARKVHTQLHINNVDYATTDAAQGFTNKWAPYHAIAITGSVATLPAAFLQHLRPGGRLFAVIGTAPAMQATLFTRVSETQWDETILFETVLPPLQNAEHVPTFAF